MYNKVLPATGGSFLATMASIGWLGWLGWALAAVTLVILGVSLVRLLPAHRTPADERLGEVKRTLGAVAVVITVTALTVVMAVLWQMHVTNIKAQHDRAVLAQQARHSILKTHGSSTCAQPQPTTGRGFAWLGIPSIRVSLPVIDGSEETQLNTGAVGRVTSTTALPGNGNLALAAHVVSVGNPFLRLHDVRPGNLAYIRSNCGTYTYKVVWVKVVRDTDVSVLAKTSEPSLTLITCWPATYNETTYRTVVRATLAPPLPGR